MEHPSSFRFCTDDLPERDRVPIWREVFGQSVVKVDLEPLEGESFYFDTQLRLLPNLGMASFAVSASRISRTPSLVADGDDDFILSILRSGRSGAAQRGQEVVQAAGEAFLWTNGATGTCHNLSPIELTTLVIPRAVLAPAIADIDQSLMKIIPAESEAVRLLTGYIDMLQREAPRMSPELQALSAAHVHDLAALAIGANRDAAEIAKGRGVRAARLRAIKADIAANLTRRNLSVDFLVTRHGISARYIRALFDSEHTTFTDFVLRQRLARVYRQLGDPRFDGQTISAIAFESGFGDLSYFNHAFRRQYGATPTDVRATAQQQGKT